MVDLRWLCIALLAALLLLQPTAEPRFTGTTKAAQAASGLTLIVDFGNGTVLNTTDLAGTDVLEVTESQYILDINWYGSLAFVTSIAGTQNDATKAWQYWVNGIYASVACNIFEVSDGDTIVWNYTSSRFTGESRGQPSGDTLLGVALVGGFGVAVLFVLYWLSKRRE
ncbi:DUF4430 domain-containing protein [Candidatus Thorarchaeota archaeon]|nr:MAG: DUF4430 domain-containing protein [Candidatus Thorarchaeota archaeon]